MEAELNRNTEMPEVKKEVYGASDPYVGHDPILFDSNSSYRERTMSVTNTELCMDESMSTSKFVANG